MAEILSRSDSRGGSGFLVHIKERTGLVGRRRGDSEVGVGRATCNGSGRRGADPGAKRSSLGREEKWAVRRAPAGPAS